MPGYVFKVHTSMTVGPLEAHAGASWVSAGATRCAADVPSQESPADPLLPFLFLCSAPSCATLTLLSRLLLQMLCVICFRTTMPFCHTCN